MNPLRVILFWFLMSASAFGATFFDEFEQAYLKGFEQIVGAYGTNAFSVSIGPELQALPAGFWEKLRPRLKARGMDVSSYLPCEELQRSGQNRVVAKATGRLAFIYVIENLQWGGDGRLLVSWAQRCAPLGEQGGTFVLELKEGRWVVTRIAKTWVS